MQANAFHGRPVCTCFIVPPAVLRRYARDTQLDAATRAHFQESYTETMRQRTLREAARVATLAARRSTLPTAARLRAEAAATPTKQRVFDCEHKQSLPGDPVNDPANAGDEAEKMVYQVTAKVDEFYRTLFHRSSVDNDALDLVSSLHYRRNFNNAFWNGQQMVYGDGDGKIFTEFFRSPDVIGHELTHGVTQYESGLRYEGESGALNESVSDVFGAVFNQWLNQWPADKPEGWLIGAGIMGPKAKATGKTCLRDMADPGAGHCLSPQPSSYADFDPAGDVHDNSGIPNKAFTTFARSLGGHAWDKAAQVWYAACTDRRLPSAATFSDFAALTIEAARRLEVGDQAAAAWHAVQVPLPGPRV